MEGFRIRPYGKGELARMYFPQSPSEGTAARNFYNLLVRNTPLLEELRAAGYRPHTRVLTARMVRIVVKYLEEP